MNPRKYLIAAIIAVLLTAAQLAGWNALINHAVRTAPRAIANPDAGIPVLPEIQVRPTPEDIRAAFGAGGEVTSSAHPDFAMPFYSFAVKIAAANKG
ncbi:MAG: hypothetical protein ACREPN_00340 [Rudaea sp.]